MAWSDSARKAAAAARKKVAHTIRKMRSRHEVVTKQHVRLLKKIHGVTNKGRKYVFGKGKTYKQPSSTGIYPAGKGKDYSQKHFGR